MAEVEKPKAKMTLTTLRAGATSLGVDLGALKTVKDIIPVIDAHLKTIELGYECPACGKDIPDVPACPYCGENFNEDEAAAPETTDIVAEVAETVADAVISKADQAAATKAAKQAEKDAAKAAKDAAKAVKTEGSEGAGRPVGKTKNTEEKEVQFAELVEIVDKAIGEGFEKRDRKTGVTYVKDGKRLLKVVSVSKTTSVEFNVIMTGEDENLTKYTIEEAKAKHLGSTTAIYALGDIATATNLIKEAIKTFG